MLCEKFLSTTEPLKIELISMIQTIADGDSIQWLHPIHDKWIQGPSPSSGRFLDYSTL
jgi:hypothetical protein